MLTRDEPLSSFALNSNLRHYSLRLAIHMYADRPHAREAGRLGEGAEVAAGLFASYEVMEGHDVPPDVLTSVIYWLQKGCLTGEQNPHASAKNRNPVDLLNNCRRQALEGGMYCHNDGCEVVGHLKEFKICPQCRNTRYCGDACQKQDWNAGGHKETCGRRTSRFSFA